MKTTIYLAIDDNGSEWIFENIPIKKINGSQHQVWYPVDINNSDGWLELPKGTIQLMTGVEEISSDQYIEYRGFNDWELKV